MPKGMYDGGNKYIKCPGCGKKIEVYPWSFQDGEMTTIRCGHYASNKMRAPLNGCDAIIGLTMTLEASFQVFKMEKV